MSSRHTCARRRTAQQIEPAGPHREHSRGGALPHHRLTRRIRLHAQGVSLQTPTAASDIVVNSVIHSSRFYAHRERNHYHGALWSIGEWFKGSRRGTAPCSS